MWGDELTEGLLEGLGGLQQGLVLLDGDLHLG